MYTSYLAKKSLTLFTVFCDHRRGSTLFLRSVTKTSTALVCLDLLTDLHVKCNSLDFLQMYFGGHCSKVSELFTNLLSFSNPSHNQSSYINCFKLPKIPINQSRSLLLLGLKVLSPTWLGKVPSA